MSLLHIQQPTGAHICYQRHFINNVLLRHVSAFKGPSSGSTPDTLQDIFQSSKGHVQKIRQIYFKTCFSPQTVMFRKYARYISRNNSALKGSSSGCTTDIFQDMFEPYKDHVQEIQGGSNMTGTDLCVNKPHCAAAVRP